MDPTGEIVPFLLAGLFWGSLDVGMQLLNNRGNFECINWWDTAFAGALGGLGGGLLGKSFIKGAGKEWSHWVPDRFIRPMSVSGKNANPFYKPWLDNSIGRWFVNSRLNGNYVSHKTHFLTDIFRNYSGLSKADKFPFLLQQTLRLPGWIPGLPLTGAAAYEAFIQNECGCNN